MSPHAAATMPPMPEPPACLKETLDRKRQEVARCKAGVGMAEMEALVAQADPPRNFFRAVTRHPDAVHFSIIAEIKRRHPWDSPGPAPTRWIRPEYESDTFDPGTIARAFHEHGAAAIACQTDEPGYGGRLSYIDRIKEAAPLPVLRTDYLIDPWQLWESRAAGADAVRITSEFFTEGELIDMLILSQQLQLTALLEVHDMEHLLRVRPHVGFPHPGYSLVGINNRELEAARADLVEDRSTLVSESGVTSREDLLRLRGVGVRIAVVGEHLMKNPDPGRALGDLLRTPFKAAQP